MEIYPGSFIRKSRQVSQYFMDSSSLSDGTSNEFIRVVGVDVNMLMVEWFSVGLLSVQDEAHNKDAIMRIMAEMDEVLSKTVLVYVEMKSAYKG